MKRKVVGESFNVAAQKMQKPTKESATEETQEGDQNKEIIVANLVDEKI